MILDKNTYGTVILIYVICALGIFLLLRYVPQLWLSIPLSVFLLLVAGWQTYFHMVPDRVPAGDGHRVSAVSDGVVVRIEKVMEDKYLHKEALLISVYMDFWDLHANFWPVSGTVSMAEYIPGKHMLAFKPKASEENEHSCTIIRTDDGKDVMFKQLAGGFARRIVCYAKPGLQVSAGEQCGIIKFGSRIDCYLPSDAEVHVKVGDKVKAVESILALI